MSSKQVPQFVKDQYRLPLPKITPVCQEVPEAPDGRGEKTREDLEEEENEFLACVISMQENILKEKSKEVEKLLLDRKRKKSSEDDLKATKIQEDGEKKEVKKRKSSPRGVDDASTDSDCRCCPNNKAGTKRQSDDATGFFLFQRGLRRR